MDASNLQSYRQKAYDFLVDQIASMVYKAGDKLNERDIAELLGISRTPVREAMQLLAAEGWVSVLPRSGTVVNGLSLQRIEEVFQIRLSLETLSASLLTGAATPAMLEALRELVRRQHEAAHRDSREFVRLDREFHNTIAAFSGNALLSDILTKINSPLVRIGLQSVCDRKRYGWSMREHDAIIDAIADGHKRNAIRTMYRHIERTRLNLHKQLSKSSSGTNQPAP